MKYQTIGVKVFALDAPQTGSLFFDRSISIGTDQQTAILDATSRASMFRVLLAVAVAVILTLVPLVGWADDDDDDEIPFAEANLFFELNDTDGDLGIHALIDGDPWKKLSIEDPRGRKMLKVSVKGRLKRQGLTEIFFESAEPSFDELDPEEFFSRFPEGEYEIEGKTLEGEELESEVEVTHVMPAPADNILVSGVAAAEDCDADPLPSVSGPIIISWDPVTTSHPEIGKPGNIDIEFYEVVVEREEPSLLVFSVELPPSETKVEIPSVFTALAEEFKFEILAQAESGNRTAVESCFVLE